MKNIVRFFIASSFVAASVELRGQAIEIGAFAGTANYMGDLVENGIDLDQTKLSGGLFFRYNIGSHFSMRLKGTMGVVAGTDANAKDAERRERNLSFESQITEGA